MATLRSAYPDVQIPTDTTITKYVFDKVHKHSNQDKVAVVNAASGATISFAELTKQVLTFANGLKESLKLEPGQVVALVLPNSIEYYIAFFAVVGLRAVVSTFNPSYTKEEIHHQLVDCNARALITLSPLLDGCLQAAEGTQVDTVVCVGLVSDVQGVLRFEDVLLAGENPSEDLFAVPAQFDGKSTLAIVPYSSGTSGLPKGVMLSHANVLSNLMQVNSSPDLLNVDQNAVVSAILPFFHIYGLVSLLLNGLVNNVTMVLLPKFEPVAYLKSIQDHKITHLFIAPPVAGFLAKHPIVAQFDVSSVFDIFCGAAPLSESLAQACADRLKACVRQGYGMTELSPAVNVARFQPYGSPNPKYGSIGRLLPNLECRIVDPNTLEPVEAGQEGEVWYKGPNVMLGYLHNEKATRETLTEDGFLRTGDVGYVDDEGDFFITDRLKELIKVKGFQVAPAELEAMLKTHPEVLQAGVIGIPDDKSGEVPKAYVQLTKGLDAFSPEQLEALGKELITHCAASLAEYKTISQVEFLATVPVTASGKILRRELRLLAKQNQQQ
eukprot:c39243_g1_i1.p1 GENE.c39243_g1_i1~~c39243_g1_i1.p1  ORF type:complete len:563 (-),score=140.39 c39243_g1_i1:39-1697(-)